MILGYEDCVGFFGDRHKIGLVLGVIFMHLGYFLKVKSGDIVLGWKKIQIFFGVLEFPDIFW